MILGGGSATTFVSSQEAVLGIIQGLASVLSVDAGSIKVRLTLQATVVVISYSISVPTTLFASLELKLESTTVVQLQTAITVGLRTEKTNSIDEVSPYSDARVKNWRIRV